MTLSSCSLLAPSDDALSGEFGQSGSGGHAGDAGAEAGSDATPDVDDGGSDQSSCGLCYDHAESTCESDVCVFQKCDDGYLDRNRNLDDGCELQAPIPTSGLALWLDAEQGIQLENGAVAAWQDQSSRHNDYSQAETDSRPTLTPSGLGSKPVVTFNSDYLKATALDFDSSSGWTFVAVALRQASSGAFSTIFDSFEPNGNNTLYLSQYGLDNDFVIGAAADHTRTTNAKYTPDVAHLLSATVDMNGNVKLRIDGKTASVSSPVLVLATSVVRDSSVGTNSWIINDPPNAAYHDGYIAEFMLYEGARSDIATIEQYLQTKWSCCAL